MSSKNLSYPNCTLNLRTLDTYNPNIRWKNLVRSSNLSGMNQDAIGHILSSHTIHTIVDLRAPREMKEHPYDDYLINALNYVSAPLDPWNQPDWFKAPEYQTGSDEEIAYRFFALGCRDSLRKAIQALITIPDGKGAIVHCVAGKDRTGIFFTLLHLLTDADTSMLMTDYLVSEADVTESKIQLVLDIIETEGGIEQYLLNCGLSKKELTAIRRRIGTD